ncbi:MAG: hypothetical protein KAJ51_15600, partial [Thermoplasmata archaeon]|nr:hypothetical protein [Thermoplasmata archaeon]
DIAVDPYRNYVWVATSNGIGFYDKRTTQWNLYPNGIMIEFTSVTVGRENIWFGTLINEIYRIPFGPNNEFWGLNSFNLPSRSEDNAIQDLEFDLNTNKTWAATDTGLYHTLDPISNMVEFRINNEIISDEGNCIAINSDQIWFGTDNGAICYNKQNEILKSYTTDDGLISNQITGIEIQPTSTNEDVIWFSTPIGISKLDIKSNNWVDYTTKDGLGSDHVTSIAHHDRYGVMWFGTTNGLTSLGYTADNWRTLTTGNGLSSNALKTFEFDENGWAWVITDNGVGFYNDEGWTPLKMVDDNIRITSIAHYKNEVWLGTDSGLQHLEFVDPGESEPEMLETFTVDTGLPSNIIIDVKIGDDGVVWVATDNGSGYYQNEQWFTLTTADGLVSNDLSSIAIDNDVIWFGTFDKGISTYNPATQAWNGYNTTNGIISNKINEIIIDYFGEIVWVGTDKGVSRYYKPYGLWFNFTEAKGLVDNNVTSIATPRDEDIVMFGTPEGLSIYRGYYGFQTLKVGDGLASNNITALAMSPAPKQIVWVGTDAGITRYDLQAKQWKTYSTSNGLAANDIRIVTLDGDTVWVGAYGGVNLYDKNTEVWQTYTTDDGLSNNFVYDIMVDDVDNLVWFGTDGGGVAVYDKNDASWSQYLPEDGLAAEDVLALELDEQTGQIWFGTDGGASSYNKSSDEWTTYESKKSGGSGLADNWVADVKVVGNTVWFATNEGVCEYDKVTAKWRTYTTADGLGDNVVKCIELVDGTIWVGTNGGASYYNATTGQWFTLTKETSEGIPENRVYDILDTPEYIWIGTGGGISRYNKSQDSWEVFTTSDGLSNNFVNTIVQDGNAMWFGTNGGVSLFNLVRAKMFLPMQVLEAGYLPELVVAGDDVTLSDLAPKAGEQLTITINLRNIGGIDVSAWVGLYLEDPYEIMNASAIGFKRGTFSTSSTQALKINWTPPEGAKQYSLYVILDPLDEVPERDKNNNRVLMVIYVEESELSSKAQELPYLRIILALIIFLVIIIIIIKKLYRKR